MVPGPLLASPPVTFHVTLAAPPAVSVAVNCSTEEPDALVALQPVQLVSMLPVPGAIVKVPFDGLAVTPPPPQPARITSAGTRAMVSARTALPRRRADPRFGPCPGCTSLY